MSSELLHVLDKALFQSKSTDIFLISPLKYDVVFIRSASLRYSTSLGAFYSPEILIFFLFSCFLGEIRKIFTGYPPLSRPMIFNDNHNICFHGEIRKVFADIPSYLEVC